MRINRAEHIKASRFKAAFTEIAAILEQEEHNDASLFRMIAGVAQQNAELAVVLADNIAAILDQHTDGADISYTSVLISAYQLSLFKRTEGFSFYDAFEGDPAEAERFAINFKLIAGTPAASIFVGMHGRPH